MGPRAAVMLSCRMGAAIGTLAADMILQKMQTNVHSNTEKLN
jgi:hypothetical protein